MLKNSLSHSTLFHELAPIVEHTGLRLVDLAESRQHLSFQVRIVIMAPGRITGIEDCSTVHKLLQPRLEMISGEKDLQLEVSTPGIQRVFRDIHEFSVFSGESVNILTEADDSWISGRILQTDAEAVYIGQFNENEAEEMIRIPFKTIRKAKLHVFWEGKN